MIALPIDRKLDQIKELFLSSQNLVLTAAPGAGKTTRLPPACLNWVDGKVLVLEPRRMAAVAAANRVCEENGWQLGQECGYQIRFENRTSKTTRLIFQTEALLVKQLLRDPNLADVSLVILDEFHERSADVDLALGAIREMQLIGHPIKLIVMSATLESKRISKFLDDCPMVDVEGTLHEIKIQYFKKSMSLKTDLDFFQELNHLVKSAFKNSQRDLLVFLPGVAEIHRAIRNLSDWFASEQIYALPLHGNLNLQEQKLAINAGKGRRVIFSTNIAESSVTIDGVDTVIDSGLARVNRWDIKTGFSKLKLERISKFSAKQRAGRSARQFPGQVYRMWNLMDEAVMSLDQEPEILRIDLADSLLTLAELGVSNFKNFTWYEAPPENHMEAARNFLLRAQLLDEKNVVTKKAMEANRLPLTTRLASMFIDGQALHAQNLAALMVAVISEKDFLKADHVESFRADKWECDLQPRLHLLLDKRSGHEVLQSEMKIAWEVAVRLLGGDVFLKNKSGDRQYDFLSDRKMFLDLLARNYSDRLARRRPGTRRGLMVGGRGVRLHDASLVQDSDFFFCIEGIDGVDSTETIIRLACGLSKEEVINIFSDKIIRLKKIVFHAEKNLIQKEEARFLYDLPIDEPTYSAANKDEIAEALPKILLENWDRLLVKNEALNAWMQRFDFFCDTVCKKPELWQEEWTSFEHIQFSTSRRLEALSLAAMGQSNLQSLFENDIAWAFESLLPLQLAEFLNKQLPMKIQVPSGSWIPLNYSKEQGVHIEVRLQEIFGWSESPKLFNGQVPLTFHLLAPNYRAVQLTKDLASFWKNTYFEVRKELRLKYPKHSWPEDPTTAIAVAKGRSQKN